MKGQQTIKWNLPGLTYAAGNPFQILLNSIPTKLQGRFVHVDGITFEVDADPTFTTAPTEIGVNNLVTRLRISDGRNDRFNGRGFAALRMKEIIEQGGLLHPDPDLNSASTNNFYTTRTWYPGPPLMAGAPSDFSIPAAALQGGVIEGTFGAITDFSADTTVLTGTIRVCAHLSLRDKIRIPPVYEYREYDAAGSRLQIPGPCLVAFAAFFNDSAYGAITAGDCGAFTVDTGLGPIVSAVDAELLTKMFHAEMQSGHLTPVHGDTRSATDDNPKVVNGGTPTALVAPTARIQPVLYAPVGCQITKLVAYAPGQMDITWNGTQATGVFGIGRFLEQPPTAIASVGDEAARHLHIAAVSGAGVKTLSKKSYAGPRSGFMPYDIDV